MHHCTIDDQLHSRGLKKTHPRHRIIELFQQPRLWNATALQQQLHDIGRATIFRTLKTLRKEGVLVEVGHNTEESAFERANLPHHDHLVCERCNRIECRPCPAPKLANHAIELHGTCAICLA